MLMHTCEYNLARGRGGEFTERREPLRCKTGQNEAALQGEAHMVHMNKEYGPIYGGSGIEKVMYSCVFEVQHSECGWRSMSSVKTAQSVSQVRGTTKYGTASCHSVHIYIPEIPPLRTWVPQDLATRQERIKAAGNAGVRHRGSGQHMKRSTTCLVTTL